MATPTLETLRSCNHEELSSRQLCSSTSVGMNLTLDSASVEATKEEEETRNVSRLYLEEIAANLENRFPALSFAVGRALDSTDKKLLVVTQRALAFMPPLGYTSRIQATIQEDGQYRVSVLQQGFEDGTVTDETDVCWLLNKICDTSYKFCPGIDWTHYHEHYFNVIHFHLKTYTYRVAFLLSELS